MKNNELEKHVEAFKSTPNTEEKILKSKEITVDIERICDKCYGSGEDGEGGYCQVCEGLGEKYWLD